MPQETDLTGLGMSSQLAAALGNQPNIVNCLGTALSGAANVLTKNSELVASASNTGVALLATAHIGSPFYFFCSSSTSAVIYVPSGHYLNGTQNGTYTLAQNTALAIMQYKRTYWAAGY